MYKRVRMISDGYNKTIMSGLTLEEAQAHCQDPETSGSTCSDLSKRGMWFDAYVEE